MDPAPIERNVETKVSEYAILKDCLCLKLNLLGRIGWPDRLFLYYGAKVLFVEFKREGEKPRKLQEYIHGKLRQYGFNVEVVDNVAYGRDVIQRFTQSSP